jgi:hypothetical protein
MTGLEMNVHRTKNSAGLMLVASVLCGCAGAFETETDTGSAIAPRVEALVDANRRYPRWADFPQAEPNAPAQVEVATRVRGLAADGTVLTEQAGRIDWTLGDPAALASEITARLDAREIAPVTAETQAEVEAFAADARRRVEAPPPVDRTPVPR